MFSRDDIIRMAQEAGFKVEDFDGTLEVLDGDEYIIQTEEMEKFATLVAAHEREQCAVDIESTSKAYWAYRAAEIVRARSSNDQA